MTLEEIIKEMREYAAAEIYLPAALKAKKWADALEQHIPERPRKTLWNSTPDEWTQLPEIKDGDRKELHEVAKRMSFDPPASVINAWPEDMPWCVRFRMLDGWQYFATADIHGIAIRSGYDPRTLHHRSKFYPEENHEQSGNAA